MAAVGWLAVSFLVPGVLIGLVGRWLLASRFALSSPADMLALLLVAALSGAAIALVAVALLKARRIGVGSIALGLGFTRVRRKWTIAGLVAIAFVWAVAAPTIVRSQPWLSPLTDQTKTLALLQIAESVSLPLRLALALVVAGIAPVAEELFFRGWLWTGLRRRWGVWPTSVATCLVFLAAHWPEGLYRPLFLVPGAILMTLARHYGDSVKASMALHIVNNSTIIAMIVAIVLAKGH